MRKVTACEVESDAHTDRVSVYSGNDSDQARTHRAARPLPSRAALLPPSRTRAADPGPDPLQVPRIGLVLELTVDGRTAVAARAQR